jgi:hypothetical protein
MEEKDGKEGEGAETVKSGIVEAICRKGLWARGGNGFRGGWGSKKR